MHGDAANHQYDIQDFFDAVSAGNFPAVSYLKAPGYQDAHAGYSDPLDEQTFVVTVINFLQKQRDWGSTAVVIAYDDSDGWYDHQIGADRQSVEHRRGCAHAVPAPAATAPTALPGVEPATLHAQGRCGYGPRLPLLVISPWARHNYVDHKLTDQTSILRFIEDNWLGGAAHRARLVRRDRRLDRQHVRLHAAGALRRIAIHSRSQHGRGGESARSGLVTATRRRFIGQSALAAAGAAASVFARLRR